MWVSILRSFEDFLRTYEDLVEFLEILMLSTTSPLGFPNKFN